MKISIFDICIHLENGRHAYYVGLIRLSDFEFLPWYENDGDHGFFEWGFYRCGWYPVKSNMKG